MLCLQQKDYTAIAAINSKKWLKIALQMLIFTAVGFANPTERNLTEGTGSCCDFWFSKLLRLITP